MLEYFATSVAAMIDASPDTRESEAARLPIEQWAPGRLVPVHPARGQPVGAADRYEVKIVSIEPLGVDRKIP